MQTQILLKTTSALDQRNTRIVLTAHQLLREGKRDQACTEIRKIERRVAAHPAVVQLRRNLVASLYGWEQEDTAISRLEPAPAVNGNGHDHGHAEVIAIDEAVAA